MVKTPLLRTPRQARVQLHEKPKPPALTIARVFKEAKSQLSTTLTKPNED